MIDGLKQKVAALTALDADGYNLVVVLCKRGRHWSPAVAELVTKCIGRRMYPGNPTHVQCLHLHGQEADYSHWQPEVRPIWEGCDSGQPHSARHIDNFTNEHAEAFRRFEKFMDEWGFIPKKPIKIKLESDDDLMKFMDGYDYETIKAVLDQLLIVKVDAQNERGQVLMRKYSATPTKKSVNTRHAYVMILCAV